MTPLHHSNWDLARVLKYAIVGALIVTIIVYIGFQARFLLQGPVVILDHETKTLQKQPVVLITGEAHNIVELTMNGRSIFTDEEGHFEEALILENGYTIMTLRAKDRYGREQIVERPFVFTGSDNS